MNETMTRLPVALLDWRPHQRNSLRGFCDIRIGASLLVRDVTVHMSHGKAWATLPSKAMIGSDGCILRDGSGKIKYAPVIEWADRSARDRFSAAVIDALETHAPGALV